MHPADSADDERAAAGVAAPKRGDDEGLSAGSVAAADCAMSTIDCCVSIGATREWATQIDKDDELAEDSR